MVSPVSSAAQHAYANQVPQNTQQREQVEEKEDPRQEETQQVDAAPVETQEQPRAEQQPTPERGSQLDITV